MNLSTETPVILLLLSLHIHDVCDLEFWKYSSAFRHHVDKGGTWTHNSFIWEVIKCIKMMYSKYVKERMAYSPMHVASICCVIDLLNCIPS